MNEITMHRHNSFLAGSPYWVEQVLGLDLAARAADGVLTHLLLNQPPVCDSRCRRCFMPNERRNNCQDKLTVDEIKRVLRDASEAGILCLEISGEGEPLLADGLLDVIQSAFDNGLTTTLITNGHALTEGTVHFLYERNVTLVVSLFSIQKDLYEMDNGLPGSFESTIGNIRMAASIYRNGAADVNGMRVLRMAIHATVQADNLFDLPNIKSFCQEHGVFFSVAPLAAVGSGADHCALMVVGEAMDDATLRGDNSIILSASSTCEVGREVCGTCLYGLNIGFDGNVLFDAHAGYEVGGILGNVRQDSIGTLIARQRVFAPMLFRKISGFCPVRDPAWPAFLQRFMSNSTEFVGDRSTAAGIDGHEST